MPVELKDLYLKASRRLTIPLSQDGSERLAFSWNPAKYNREIHETLRTASEGDENDPFKVAESGIVPLVDWWDITQDGKPWPITAENVAALGLFICMLITRELMEDMGDFREIKKGSDAL